MFESFKDRQPFVTWDRQVLRDYCEYGLLRANSGYELACPPAIEAEIYENGALPNADIYPRNRSDPDPGPHFARSPRSRSIRSNARFADDA